MKSMKIGFDAKRAFKNTSGLGNYSRTLISSIIDRMEIDELHLFSPKECGIESFLPIINADKVTIHYPGRKLDQLFSSRWRSATMTNDIKNAAVDLFHGLSHELPSGINKTKVKTIISFHDLIYERYPDQYPLVDRFFYRKKYRQSATIADKIIAISEQTKQDLVEWYDIPSSKIEVIYQGCNPIFYNKKSLDSVKAYQKEKALPSEYLLYVGSVIERKNLHILLKALAIINHTIPLVIVGKMKGDYAKKALSIIAQLDLSKRVIFHEPGNTENLALTFQGATALVYPSTFEGFGIPILEAMASQIPVITTQGGCFEETGGDAAYYANTSDVDALANAINMVMEDGTLRIKMINNGIHLYPKYNEANLCQQWIETYQSLIGS